MGLIVFVPAVGSADLAGVVDTLRAWPPAGLAEAGPEQRAAWLAGLRDVVNAAEAAFTRTLAVFDAQGDGVVLHGARNTTAWVKGAFQLTGGDAAERVRLARAADTVLEPALVKLSEGQVTLEHVRAIERALRPVPPEHHGEVVAVLTELATRTDVGQVRKAGEQVRTMVDPDGALSTRDKDFSRRRLHLSPLLDGMVSIDGILDPEAAATVNTALSPFLVPTAADDDRTTPQRRADGLVELARMALEHTNLGELGGTKPRLQVSCDPHTLAGLGGALAAELPDSPAHRGLLSRTDLDRIACDAIISRVVLGPDGIVTELGRDHRLFTGAQRQALAARDGGCRFPDCQFPPALTDAHHIISWLNGGKTNLTNAALLCRFHHRAIHTQRWRIEFLGDQPDARQTLTFIGPHNQRLTSPPAANESRNLTRDLSTWWTNAGNDPPQRT